MIYKTLFFFPKRSYLKENYYMKLSNITDPSKKDKIQYYMNQITSESDLKKNLNAIHSEIRQFLQETPNPDMKIMELRTKINDFKKNDKHIQKKEILSKHLSMFEFDDTPPLKCNKHFITIQIKI